MNLWKKLRNIGTDTDKYSEWDKRNLRLMNSMTFILAISMLFFMVMSTLFKVHSARPLLIGAFIITACFYPLRYWTGLQVAKYYFCLVPVVIVSIFAVYIVGNVGNDRYFLFVCAIIPIIIFKKRLQFVPIVVLNVIVFFSIPYAQDYVTPLNVLPPEDLQLYININGVVIFIFFFSMLQFFKTEIFGYQQEIESQKEIIEEKNMEVTQSIEYAERIQSAILPSESFRSKYLPESFVLYRPKDIVAGDFYWMEKVGQHLFFAAADCTGHGVPGAMVSVVCHNALNQAVHEFNLVEPAKILDKARELVIKTFKNSDREVKDGMDIGLCTLNLESGGLQFAGANNGLYHLSNGELTEIKPDKEPIGSFENPTPFTNHNVSISSGDVIYLFTDGFADQFGGEKGKKYKYKPFKAFIQKLQDSDIKEHGTLINEEFERWKGDLEQVDDVCIIGVRF